jgi:hypothetical protein
MKLHPILIIVCVVFVRSAESQPGENSDAICNTPECQQQLLQSRLETIEAAFRTIVTALSSQTSDLFAPVKEILAQDLAINSILSATPIRPDPTASTINSTATKNAPEIPLQITKGNANTQ